MEGFHLTEEGPRPCSAHKRPCPLGGEHYGTLKEAEEAFGETQKLFPSQKKGPAFTATLRPMKGGSYFGAEVALEVLSPYREHLRELLGDEEFTAREEERLLRDGSLKGHVTLLTPKETRTLRKLHQKVEEVSFTVRPLGLGTVQEEGAQAWFVVCKAPELQEWRASLGLPAKDLHITLAFRGRDIHSLPKDESTLI